MSKCDSFFGSLAISIGLCLGSRNWRILPDFAERGLLGRSGRYTPRQLGKWSICKQPVKASCMLRKNISILSSSQQPAVAELHLCEEPSRKARRIVRLQAPDYRGVVKASVQQSNPTQYQHWRGRPNADASPPKSGLSTATPRVAMPSWGMRSRDDTGISRQ